MEAVAFVEVLGRDGRVAVRHAVAAFPCRVGRAYDNDVILDDAYVAGHHLEITETETGRYVYQDLDTRNGTAVLPGRRTASSGKFSGNQILRIGHTQLRVRPREFKVVPELDGRRRDWGRHPATTAVVSLASAAVVAGAYYQGSAEAVEPAVLVGILFAIAAAVLVWSAGWAFASRLVTGQWSYLAHVTVAGAAILVFVSVDEVGGTLAFALGRTWLGAVVAVASAGVFAAQCYRHLRLVSRSTRLRLAAVAAAVSVVGFGGLGLIGWLDDRENVTRMDYLDDIRPPAWRLVRGVTPEQFIARAAALREKVDASGRQ